MAPTDSLFDSLRIPWQVVVNNQITKLEIDSLCGGFRGNQNRSVVTKMFHKRGAHVSRRGTCNAVCPRVLGEPLFVDGLRSRVIVRSIEDHHLPRKFSIRKQSEEIILSSAGLGENNRFLLQSCGSLILLGFCRDVEATTECGQKDFAFRVSYDRLRQRMELPKMGHFMTEIS